MSGHEENEPVTERTRFIALEKPELNEAWKMLNQKKKTLMRRNGGLLLKVNGMVSQLIRSNKILVSFRSDCHTF